MLEPLVSREEMARRFKVDEISREAWRTLVEESLGNVIERYLRDDLVRGLVFTDARVGVFTHPQDSSLLQNRCFLYHLIGNKTGEWEKCGWADRNRSFNRDLIATRLCVWVTQSNFATPGSMSSLSTFSATQVRIISCSCLAVITGGLAVKFTCGFGRFVTSTLISQTAVSPPMFLTVRV